MDCGPPEQATVYDDGSLPDSLLLPDAHLRYTERMSQAGKSSYWQKPEVWNDIQSVFDEYLQIYPNDNVARSKYAALATYTGHLAEAHAQFEILGDRLTQWSTFPLIPHVILVQMKTEVARRVKAKPPAQ